MSGIKLSVVIPTIGRLTLDRAFESVWKQLSCEDEIVIAYDGVPAPFWFNPPCNIGATIRELLMPNRLGWWGHGVRNALNDSGELRGTHIVNLDDDDLMMPGAVKIIRESLESRPNVPHLFKMLDMRNLETTWRARGYIGEGNVGTPMIVAPNDRTKLGRWGERYAGDFDFIRQTCDNYGPRRVEWEDVVIGQIWPSADMSLGAPR